MSEEPNILNEAPSQAITVFHADDFCSCDGFNDGTPLSFAYDLELDSIYMMPPHTSSHRLAYHLTPKSHFVIADDTGIGKAGAKLHLDSHLTFISDKGRTLEVVVMVETDNRKNVRSVFILPLARIEPKTPYTLLDIQTQNLHEKLAELSCVSFMEDTHITLENGEQKKIQDLQAGDMVLTRDSMAQPLRWIGKKTVRAVGEFAPILIRANTLNNQRDLIVSPDHRLFVYQRSDHMGIGRSEIMVRARHLMNGDSVIQQEGGFVDYYQLLFDEHQIIFAEGIAAETLLLAPESKPALPKEALKKLSASTSQTGARNLGRFDVNATSMGDNVVVKLKDSARR